jgi:hypothetical protein
MVEILSRVLASPRRSCQTSGTMILAMNPTPAPSDDVLRKVRSLLAKAESTTFPGEAEALTAKAQQLMDRHAIDRAVLAASMAGPGRGPEGRSVPIEAPYAREKFLLLGAVARANRCRAVLDRHSKVATVVGFPEDRETVELLFTSLLVQATSAMLAEGDRPTTRTRRYRQSFLVAFASRIGDRLREADDAVVAEADADHGGSVLPVLASRAAAVDEHLERAFPHLRSMRFQPRDRAGFAAGVDAADRADVGGNGVLSDSKHRSRRRGRMGPGWTRSVGTRSTN